MNTSELLALLAPHREALKELGCEIMYPPDNGTEYAWPVSYGGELSEESPSRLALLIESIVRRELDRIGRETSHYYCFVPIISSDSVACVWRKYSGLTATHSSHAPTPLAALLSLWAWCREVKV